VALPPPGSTEGQLGGPTTADSGVGDGRWAGAGRWMSVSLVAAVESGSQTLR